MNTTYAQIKESFRSFFHDRHDADVDTLPQFREGEYWINAPVENAKMEAIHYELIKQGNDYFVEFHVETPARFVSQWEKLRKALDGDKRHFLHYTYYSSNYWRSRYPVIGSDDVKNDLAYMVKIIEPVFANSPDDANPTSAPSVFEALPFQRNPEEVSKMLDDDTLHLPAVQRGKVWNAARIETLWDSIFRSFSIGALLCVRKRDDEKGFDLLDGQQRSNAIALAYDSFPPKQVASSILWIDVGPKGGGVLAGQKKFAFCVTTPSQPWGYGDSSDETRNSLLSASQKRDAINKLNEYSKSLTWHDENEKPWPGELYPYNAGCAVPFPLIREFMENWGDASKAGWPSFEDFLNWCSEKRTSSEVVATDCNHWWNWLTMLLVRKDDLKPWKWNDIIIAKTGDDQISRIEQLKSYSITFLDAGSIGDDEVSVYFTRIGRGGVRPSDEELAYSVLKTHLGDEFRNKIEDIHERYGLAQPSRIAHLAVRCFRSKTVEGRTILCSSPVLEEAIRMCRTGDPSSCASEEPSMVGEKDAFLNFVCAGGFDNLLAKVETAIFKAPYGLTHWHRTRYCQYSNGDIFLFLLLAIKNHLVDPDLLAASAEWIYEKASHPAQTIRFILTEGLWEGLAHSMRETYYGASRLWTPVLPTVVQKVAESAQSELITNEALSAIRQMAGDAGIADLIATGYNSQHAYGMLLYACQSLANKRFDYDRNSGVWAEDNCPWDYDHILPHSWIDRMSGEFMDICQWLKNSLGNLAPLSFEMNRSLSDKARDRLYPYCGKPERETEAIRIQKDYCIDGNALEEMRAFANDKDAQRAFIVGTLCRLSELYKKWYYGLKFDKLLTFQNEVGHGNAEIVRRRQILETLTERPDCSGFSLRYYSADGKRMPIGMLHEPDTDWFVWDWVSVFMEKGRYAIELSIDRQCQNCEIGIARLTVGDAEMLDERTIERLSKFDSKIWKRPKDDQYWHFVHYYKVPAEKADDEVVEAFAAQLDALQQAVS